MTKPFSLNAPANTKRTAYTTELHDLETQAIEIQLNKYMQPLVLVVCNAVYRHAVASVTDRTPMEIPI